MMIRDSTPAEKISRMIRWKRRKLWPEWDKVSTKKRVATPMRHTPSTTRRPMRRKPPSKPLIMRTTPNRRIGRRRVMKGNRAVLLAVHELVHIGQVGRLDLVRRALGHDHPFRDKIDVVDNFQGFMHVMGDDD